VPCATAYSLLETAGVGVSPDRKPPYGMERGIPILKTSIPLAYSDHFIAENTVTVSGDIKVIASAETCAFPGDHALGAYYSEFIRNATALIKAALRIKNMKEPVFPYSIAGGLIRYAVWML
jgi:dihydrolipoamide dehydrogenase